MIIYVCSSSLGASYVLCFLAELLVPHKALFWCLSLHSVGYLYPSFLGSYCCWDFSHFCLHHFLLLLGPVFRVLGWGFFSSFGSFVGSLFSSFLSNQILLDLLLSLFLNSGELLLLRNFCFPLLLDH